MSKSDKKLVPDLRFPEFLDEGGWGADTLEQLAKFRRGSFPQPYGLPEWYDEENGMPFVQVFDVDENLKLKVKTKNKISKLGAEQSVFIAKGTLIVTLQGSIGRVAITQYDAYIDRTLLIFEEFYKPTEKLFFAYVIQSLFEIEKEKAPGGIIKTITKESLSSFVVKLPSFPEQQKIADCLSSIDDLISAQSQKVEALKSHKKGLMQQLFPREGETVPRLRFPEFRDAGEWEVLPFKDIAKFLSGGTPSKDVPEYWGGTIPWISASSMHTTKIDKSDSNITELAVSDGARIAKKGTLLLLVRGSMLHKRIPIGIAETDVSFNQDVKALEVKGDITERYLMNFLIASESKLLAAVTATGIGAGKLDTNDLNDFLIRFPSPREQQKIADSLSSIDNSIRAQSQKLETLKTHKKGLMQQLFPSTEADNE